MALITSTIDTKDLTGRNGRIQNKIASRNNSCRLTEWGDDLEIKISATSSNTLEILSGALLVDGTL
ncbi:MAG: hypothetical protein ACK5HS_04495, partial [Mycoplasmatales bacterium]